MSDKKILIVEDSSVQAKIIQSHLKDRTPFESVIVGTLAEAKSAFTGEDDFFVAVLDLNLPDDAGGEIVKAAAEAQIASVVMTSSFNETVRDNLLQLHVVDYFLKTVPELSNLVALIERLYKNSSITALVVDDSTFSRNQIVQLLENQNYTVLTANDGQEALDMLKKHPATKLVVTDYNMPNMDGFELTAAIRQTVPKNKMAVVGLSGEGGALTARFLKHGANDFVRKPVETEEFYCRVNQQMDMLEIMEKLRMA